MRASRRNIPLSANHQKGYPVRAVEIVTNTAHLVRQHATKSLELGWNAVAPDHRGGGVTARRHGRKPKAHTRHLAI